MALLNFVFGLGAYLSIVFLSVDPLVPIFTAFFLSAICLTGLAWWLSEDVIQPVKKAALIAQSLERNPAASLPLTTGATETDELLQSLHRNSRQLQNLIGLMDDVAAGRTAAALEPFQNPDKLSSAFQKLVAKVVESIDARNALTTLERSIDTFVAHMSHRRNGRADHYPDLENHGLSQIDQRMGHLMTERDALALQIRTQTHAVRSVAGEILNSLRLAVEDDDRKTARLSRVLEIISELPAASTLHDRMFRVLESAENSVSAITPRARLAESQTVLIEDIRHMIVESLRGLAGLRSHFTAVKRTSNTLTDLSRRCGLIALNASINSQVQQKGGGLISDELTTISERAERVAAELSSLNELWLKDSTILEETLKSAGEQCFDIARDATCTGDGQNEIESLVCSLEELKAAHARFVKGPDDIVSKIRAVLENSIADGPSLSEMEAALMGLIHTIDELSASGAKHVFDSESLSGDKKTFDLIDHLSEDPETTSLPPTGLS